MTNANRVSCIQAIEHEEIVVIDVIQQPLLNQVYSIHMIRKDAQSVVVRLGSFILHGLEQ